MNPNGTRSWLRAEAADFAADPAVRYDATQRIVQLRAQRALSGFPTDRVAAAAAAARPRAARDAYGTWARLADHGRRLVVGGAGARPVQLFPGPADDAWWDGVVLTADERCRDLCWGADGVLTIAITSAASGRVLLIDRRRRWRPISLHLPGFSADRVAAHPDGGCWLLDRAARRLARVIGAAWPERGLPRNDAELGRLVRENRDPPRIVPCDQTLAAGTAVDLAVAGDGAAWALLWPAVGDAQVQRITFDRVSAPRTLAGAAAPFALALRADGGLLVLGAGAEEAAGFTPLAGSLADGERYPLPRWDGAAFVRDAALAPHVGHGVIDDAHTDDAPIAAPAWATALAGATWAPQPAAPLLRSATPPRAEVAVRSIDAGATGATWHRLLIEADLPTGCAIVVRACASDDSAPPADDAAAWVPHVFTGPEVEAALLPAAHHPRGCWRAAAPRAHHGGLLPCPPRPNAAGTFEVLLQRTGTAVRRLTGRHLHLRLVLISDSVRTPSLAALHIEGPRYAWPERWLPEHWRETRFGPDADVAGPASGPDFLERLLANAEGVLTGIEQRIAQAHLLHDPHAAPAGWLDWLGGWLGLTLDPALDARRQRACIANAMRIFRFRGTLGGLALALDCASGGAVTRGELVIVEDFRLRRTFATILGADLVDEDDPLLPGLIESGNSIVGDTLFIGQDAPALQRELLALFGADSLTASERATVRAFYDRLAQRVTILAHRDLPEDELRLVRSVIERETPAHLGRRVLSASDGLLVGVSSLVDIDTFLRDPDPQLPVRVEATTVGADGYVMDLPALDPRLDA